MLTIKRLATTLLLALAAWAGALEFTTPAEALEGLTDRVKTGAPHQ